MEVDYPVVSTHEQIASSPPGDNTPDDDPQPGPSREYRYVLRTSPPHRPGVRMRRVPVTHPKKPHPRYQQPPVPYRQIDDCPAKARPQHIFYRRFLGKDGRRDPKCQWKFAVIFWGNDPYGLKKLSQAFRFGGVKAGPVSCLPHPGPDQSPINYCVYVYCQNKDTSKKVQMARLAWEASHPLAGNLQSSIVKFKKPLPLTQPGENQGPGDSPQEMT